MYIKNRRISLIYKLVAVLICLFGQVLTLDIVNGNFKISQFLFYTNQSNILCLVYLICASVFVFKKIKAEGKYGSATFLPRFKGAVLMAITVTMLVFWFVLDSQEFAAQIAELAKQSNAYNFWPITNRIVHLIVPLITIFDWVLFDPKGSFKKYDPFVWLCIPFVYYAFSLIVAQTGYRFFNKSRYPYFFIDSDLLGWKMVFIYIVGLTLFFLLLGYIVFLIDWFLGKYKHKNNLTKNKI